MRTLLLTCLVYFLFSPVLANQHPINISSEIKEVTVFRQGAQIEREGSLNLTSGLSSVVFTNLPRTIDQQSIQLSGFGDFTILSVNYQLNYLRGQESSKEVQLLEDSLNYWQYKKAELENKLEIYKAEQEILLANKSIGGQQNGLNVEALKAAMNYFHDQLSRIKGDELRTQKEIKFANVQIQRIQQQLNNKRARRNEPTSEVVVQVKASRPGKAVFNLKYLTQNAGWIPEYDLRATDITLPVEMNYKAKIYQSSGEDWDQVKLRVSTGNPQLNNEKPNLRPWYLSFFQPQYTLSRSRPQAQAKAAETAKVFDYDQELNAADHVSFETTENQTNVSFLIDVPYSIPSDGQKYAVQVNSFSLDADYTYYSAPKIDETAYLLAKITGWEAYNLLPGKASIFFEGAFVGTSTINPAVSGDTLDLSLGRDESVMVTRTKIKDLASRSFLGLNTKETYGWEIKVKNTKRSDIAIIVEDQFPVSTHEDIEVEQLEKSGATLNATQGKLTWKFRLKALESETLQIKFAVKYPKDKKVNL
ncbi:MAG: DUF4139 domain-containing protein [Bacteroidales bacterium]|jgi:uncharacterized protein (TIGR02231 family)|nr:DUF4139 domain-containing protein [Bacteroidales bacterium]